MDNEEKKTSNHSFLGYSGKFNVNADTEPVKACHQIIKNNIIQQFSKNCDILLDIGSGRGHDYEAWQQNGIRQVIGIEPSEKSIASAIQKYIKQRTINKWPRVTYINAIGNDIFEDGSAALNDQAKQLLLKIFEKPLNANTIHMFWTIHYCLNTKQDWNKLIHNIDRNLASNGLIIILYMNGKLIHRLFNRYDGLIEVKSSTSKKNIFEIRSYYDYKGKRLNAFGNTIGIKLAGTYGLDNEIKENLVIPQFLFVNFEKRGYKLLLQDNFLSYAKRNSIQCVNNYSKEQQKITIFYDIAIFQRIN
jgi:SAM-dependent methyltransferase